MMTAEVFKKLLCENNNVLRTEIKTDIEEAKNETIASVNATLAIHHEKIVYLEQKVQQLEENAKLRDEKDLLRDVNDKRHNIILYKVGESESSNSELLAIVIKLFNELPDQKTTENDIDFLFRLGKRKSDNSSRPILIRLVSLMKKQTIMKSWKVFVDKGIEISDDFPVEIRNRRKEIVPYLKQLKLKGFKASIKIDKLWVNGEEWSISKAE